MSAGCWPSSAEVFVAPAIPYGVCRSTGDHPGTVSITTETLKALTLDLVRSLLSAGPAQRGAVLTAMPAAPTMPRCSMPANACCANCRSCVSPWSANMPWLCAAGQGADRNARRLSCRRNRNVADAGDAAGAGQGQCAGRDVGVSHRSSWCGTSGAAGRAGSAATRPGPAPTRDGSWKRWWSRPSAAWSMSWRGGQRD